MYSVYRFFASLLLFLSLPISLPLVLCVPRLRFGLKQRLGFLPETVEKKAWVGGESIWVHAASLGEVNAILPLARNLLEAYPTESFVFTCTTASGLQQAQKQFPEARAHLLMPLDLPLLLENYLKTFKPKLVVIAETELWPNFLRLLKQARCMVMVANGRLSERSFGRYRLLQKFFSQVTQDVDVFAMQSQEDAQRILALGAHPSKVAVEGNTKFDLAQSMHRLDPEHLRQDLGLKSGQNLIVAGSTRPGEEEIIIKSYLAAKKEAGDCVLLLAPRHLQRLGEVARLLENLKLPFATVSALRQGRGAQADIWLLDSFGELAQLYCLASLAIIGGSWEDFGGQNPLEPAWQGAAVVMGPHMENFKEAAKVLVQAGAARQLKGNEELTGCLRDLLKSPGKLQAMGKAGRKAVEQKAGASLRLLGLAQRLLLIREFRQKERTWREQSGSDSRSSFEFGNSFPKKGKSKKGRFFFTASR